MIRASTTRPRAHPATAACPRRGPAATQGQAVPPHPCERAARGRTSPLKACSKSSWPSRCRCSRSIASRSSRSTTRRSGIQAEGDQVVRAARDAAVQRSAWSIGWSITGVRPRFADVSRDRTLPGNVKEGRNGPRRDGRADQSRRRNNRGDLRRQRHEGRTASGPDDLALVRAIANLRGGRRSRAPRYAADAPVARTLSKSHAALNVARVERRPPSAWRFALRDEHRHELSARHRAELARVTRADRDRCRPRRPSGRRPACTGIEVRCAPFGSSPRACRRRKSPFARKPFSLETSASTSRP